MNPSITVEPTPSPFAMKFVAAAPVRGQGKASFESAAAAAAVPLVAALFALKGVRQVLLSDRTVVVTQDGTEHWTDLEARVLGVLEAQLPGHNPDFAWAQPAPASGEKLQQIEAVLDRTIRPALQRDGGDLRVMGMEGNVLLIHYEGACGCCPGATMGTLAIIRGILRDEYDPAIDVRAV